MREIREELGCDVTVDRWLAGDAADRDGVRPPRRDLPLCSPASRQRRRDHDLLVWLGPDELDRLDWLEPDRPFLPDLRTALLGSEA